MAIHLGDKAPDFTLFDSDKNETRLSDYRDKKNVLLLFFPLAFTSVCTAELCSVRDGIHKYDNEHAVVFGISVDSTYTLAKFKEEQGYTYQLLSDFNKTASKSYGSFYEIFGAMKMEGVSKRSAFIIDKKGLVQYAEVLENPGEVPDFKSIDRKLAELV